MNFYSWNIGDYASATRHLSWDEDLAYRRMLDAYYQREAPLPVEKRAIYRLVAASEDRHRQAVDIILEEFFELRDDGWHNARAEEEIARASEKKEKARANANKRWLTQQSLGNAPAQNSHADDMPSHSAEMPPHSEGNAPNPNPNPNKEDKIGRDSARAITFDQKLENQLREAAGWQNEPAPKLAVTGPIQALINAGADLDLDVIPTIRAFAPQVRSRTSWTYFIDPIKRARDQRRDALSPAKFPSTAGANSYAQPRSHPRQSARDELRDAFTDVRQRVQDAGD